MKTIIQVYLYAIKVIAVDNVYKGNDFMTIIVIFGTRPEAIKMCPLILKLKMETNIKCIVCLTGQHKEMLEQVMETFKIQADYNLSIMKDNQTLSWITTSILQKMDEIIEKEKPNLVLVHGDTTTSFSAALSAFYHSIPIGHVEAGLRTYDLNCPFPEEFNRQTIDILAKYYFTPTEETKKNLLKEKVDEKYIYVTGNTVIDALRTTINNEYTNSELEWVGKSRLILVTVHRRENLGLPMERIFAALKRIVEDNEDVKIIYPVHKNPAIRKLAKKYLGDNLRIHLIEPLDVFDFHNFMSRSFIILTDSGGIQEEAPALGKPVLVMRDKTERQEGVKAGTLKLVGTSESSIYYETSKLLRDKNYYESMSKAVNPYGDGHASEKIVEAIKEIYNL